MALINIILVVINFSVYKFDPFSCNNIGAS